MDVFKAFPMINYKSECPMYSFTSENVQYMYSLLHNYTCVNHSLLGQWKFNVQYVQFICKLRMEKKYIIYGLHKKLYILCTIFPLICISICYICIVAFKTLHKPYISERMFHLYFLLKQSRFPLFINILRLLILNDETNKNMTKKTSKQRIYSTFRQKIKVFI